MTGEGRSGGEGARRSLEHVTRLLEQAQTNRAALLARDFVLEAQDQLDLGDSPHARRSLAAARLALRYGGHESTGAASSPLGEESVLAPHAWDPPAPRTVLPPL